jgi:acetyltransferase-like isoleucine patch superfamily enzyme
MYRLYLFFYSFKYKIFNFIKFIFFKIKIEKNTKINGSLFLKGRGSIDIGKNVIINSSYLFNPIGSFGFTSLVVEKEAKLTIKDNVGLSNSAIYCRKSIIIEEFVLIGGGCKIYDTDFHSIYSQDRKNRPETGVKSAEVLICSGAFIGAGSVILKGVTIGKNAVIGAGSIVSKNVPSNEIWAGNPAKFIKNI